MVQPPSAPERVDPVALPLIPSLRLDTSTWWLCHGSSHLRFHQTPPAFQLNRLSSSQWFLLGQLSNHLCQGSVDLLLHSVSSTPTAAAGSSLPSGLPLSAVTPASSQSSGNLAPILGLQCHSAPSAICALESIGSVSVGRPPQLSTVLSTPWCLPLLSPLLAVVTARLWVCAIGRPLPLPLVDHRPPFTTPLAPSPHPPPGPPPSDVLLRREDVPCQEGCTVTLSQSCFVLVPLVTCVPLFLPLISHHGN